MGGDKYQVILEYFSDLGSQSGSNNARPMARANTSSEETHRDIHGELMETEYSVAGATVSQFFTGEIERPRIIYEFTYTTTDFPQSEIDAYSGKINSVPWLGYGIHTIQCTNIFVDDNGTDFRVRFTFQFNPETWIFNPVVAYHFNKITAHPTRPDPDLNLDNGTKLYDMFETVDFTPLGFNFSGPRNFSVSSGAISIAGFDATLTKA